jgi:hypothetical protein
MTNEEWLKKPGDVEARRKTFRKHDTFLQYLKSCHVE